MMPKAFERLFEHCSFTCDKEEILISPGRINEDWRLKTWCLRNWSGDVASLPTTIPGCTSHDNTI